LAQIRLVVFEKNAKKRIFNSEHSRRRAKQFEGGTKNLP